MNILLKTTLWLVVIIIASAGFSCVILFVTKAGYGLHLVGALVVIYAWILIYDAIKKGLFP